MATKTQPLRRSETTTDCSANNTCLGGGIGSNSLVIILGSWYYTSFQPFLVLFLIRFSSIPILIACVVLFFIHRAHLKRVRREEKNDKDFDMDFGIGELPNAHDVPHPNEVLGGKAGHDPHLSGRVASLKEMDLQPPTGGLPYLVPKANVSRESLHSLSDPRDNPYAAIYTSSAPSSPVGAFSPFSDQLSIRSTRNLLTPASLAEEQSPNFGVKPPLRVPSPLAIHDMPQTSHPSPSRSLTHSLPDSSGPPRGSTVNKSPSPSPHRGNVFHKEDRNGDSTSPSSRRALSSSMDSQTLSVQSANTVALDLDTVPPPSNQNIPPPISESEPTPEDQNTSHTIFRSQIMTEDENRTVPPAVIENDFDVKEVNYPQRRINEAKDTNFDGEADEDRAKRIQSVYKEYWNDSQYYDGSEEWESLPHSSNYDDQYHNSHIPSHYSRQEWEESNQTFHEDQNWPRGNEDFSMTKYRDSRNGADPVGLGISTRWQGAPTQHSIYSHPSTSYSTSSLPYHARTPSKPLEPLTNLPNTRYKLDDLASPISFSKPRRFIGSAGSSSPANRPASPAQVLSSSWSNLAELPVPHRLRRSGSFSSIDFAPVRKYASSEVDAGDTGSIRSLARTEASLMAVSAGAGRINRLPQDLVPMGKSGALSSLRPQNYEDVRYV
jgi:hypothetical protein